MTRIIIDGLQYCKWSPEIFEEMRIGGVTAVHATVSYWETFRETVSNIATWKKMLREFPFRMMLARTADDIRMAQESGRTAIILGAQNCTPLDGDIGLVEILHDLGLRIMQLTYNNQSLLATGCYEPIDNGLTRMGRQVICEMNRVGMVVDLSHCSARSAQDAIEHSCRPVAITHANPSRWHSARRNFSDDVLRALAESGGILGLSTYPHHLKGGSGCSLRSFCEMAARTAEIMGTKNIAIGSDLCQGQPNSVVEWMRNGTWTRTRDYGEGSEEDPGFPEMPQWFSSNKDFGNIAAGLAEVGFSASEVESILGLNWLAFFDRSFSRQHCVGEFVG